MAAKAYRQRPDVNAWVRDNLDTHHAGQHRIVMRNERGDLLLLWREARSPRRLMSVTRVVRLPVDTNWRPDLIKQGLLKPTAAAA